MTGIFVLKVTLKNEKKNQERALRFVYDDFKSTYEELLNKANIPFLHIMRIRRMTVETFRILNDIYPPVLSDLVRIILRLYFILSSEINAYLKQIKVISITSEMI